MSGADAHALITIVGSWICPDGSEAKWTQCAWSLCAKLNERNIYVKKSRVCSTKVLK